MTVDEFLNAVRREDVWERSFYIDGLIPRGDPGFREPGCLGDRLRVSQDGAEWRVFRCHREYNDVYYQYDKRFPSQAEALDYAWQKIYCDPDNRTGIHQAKVEIEYQLAVARRIWEKSLPQDEVWRMSRAKERDMEPDLEAARAQYAKPLCIDPDAPVAAPAEKNDT